MCDWQIDPAEEDTRNELSHYTVNGQNLWGRAYTYCTRASSTPIDCDEGSRYLEAANETLPELLKAAEGTLGAEQYREQVLGMATRRKLCDLAKRNRGHTCSSLCSE